MTFIIHFKDGGILDVDGVITKELEQRYLKLE